jgi:hypothetical protein
MLRTQSQHGADPWHHASSQRPPARTNRSTHYVWWPIQLQFEVVNSRGPTRPFWGGLHQVHGRPQFHIPQAEDLRHSRSHYGVHLISNGLRVQASQTWAGY